MINMNIIQSIYGYVDIYDLTIDKINIKLRIL